jgi:pimeloyl-ACP methyl ester carboxylesterase
MPDSDPTTHLLDVPGARLSYGRRGAGPLLLMIGSPMDSSGGAVVGLALVTGHPGQVRTLVAHEPPVVELLADAAQLRAQIDDICDTYRVEGAEKAMQKFMAHAGLGEGPAREAGPPQWEPSPEQLARMRATTGHFLAHLLRPTTRYRPDIEALQTASTRIVVAGGARSKGQLANRSALALADQLGTTMVDFPGDHGGFLALPEQFGRLLDQVLTQGLPPAAVS